MIVKENIQRVAPILTVSNSTMVKMRDFFVEKLGFVVGTEIGNGPVFVTLDRDGQTIMLHCTTIFNRAQKTWAAYFWVCDIDEFYAELIGRNTPLKGGIVDKEYGCREIVV